MGEPITIFRARKVVTMNPSNPGGTHIAVRAGRILGVGTLDEVKGWGPYELDETFADLVLVPGFVEAHGHALEGAQSILPTAGYFDIRTADGEVRPGIKSYDELVRRLKALDAALTNPDEPLVVLGFDPIYFPAAERLTSRRLDLVSTTRSIVVVHASGHAATVNSVTLQKNNITRDTKTAGVVRGPDGQLSGELQEAPAMLLTRELHPVLAIAGSEQTILNYGKLARNAGVTTTTELGGPVLMQPEALPLWQRLVDDPAFPARIVMYSLPTMHGTVTDWGAMAVRLKQTQAAAASDKLRFPGIKLVIDGSIQGWTAVLNEPGYYTGEDHGLLLTVPEQLVDWMRPFHQAGMNIHVHCNGDKTADVMLNAVEQLLTEHAWLDHRHTCQHAQLVSAAQLRRMARLGVCVNFFANHIWYWGDQHYEQTLGPERANRLEPCATAMREGVQFSFHSDSGVTPLGHLHTMWCMVNRVTPSGRVLGEHEKISAYDALKAATLGAAYQLHMDDEIGTLECGKLADFAVLEESPLDVEPMKIRDIGVWGTVVGGVKYAAPGR